MRTLTALALLLTATTASADIFGDCSSSEKRSVAAPAGGITRVVIIGRAGTLHIGGRKGAPEVSRRAPRALPAATGWRKRSWS
jgi:hypothetical protein